MEIWSPTTQRIQGKGNHAWEDKFQIKKSTVNQEIYEKNPVTTILYILHLTNWPHLCGNDASTVILSLTATHKGSKRALMGQASRRSLIQSINERPGLKMNQTI